MRKLAALPFAALVGCLAACGPTLNAETISPPTTQAPVRNVQLVLEPASQSFGTVMASDGFSAAQISVVDTYRHRACAMLTEDPDRGARWTLNTVISEVQDSYDIRLTGRSANAIVASCH
ncbi:MAG: hypothetical protein GX610_13880 [Rhodococcus sp.]|nr:hypothetical protein [Rhodococcus sp. (in: high G+C Gram-positive bacteria)]